MQEQVKRRMDRADVQGATVESFEIPAFPAGYSASEFFGDQCVRDGCFEVGDCRCFRQEFSLESFAVFGVAVDDFANFCVTCAIQKGVDKGFSLVTLGKARRRAGWLCGCRR